MRGRRRLRLSEHLRRRRRRRSRSTRLLGIATTEAGVVHVLLVVGAQELTRRTWGGDEHALPTVAIDYAYLGDPTAEGDEKASPILVLKSGRDRWTSSEVYPAKGVQQPWCAKNLARELAALPWQRFTLKSDQEPAISALKAEAVRIVQSVTGREVVLEGRVAGG